MSLSEYTPPARSSNPALLIFCVTFCAVRTSQRAAALNCATVIPPCCSKSINSAVRPPSFSFSISHFALRPEPAVSAALSPAPPYPPAMSAAILPAKPMGTFLSMFFSSQI